MTAPTALHSNATNFASFVKSGVDPRTGLYTVSCSLPEVKTCDLSGPVVPLQLGFNPLNTLDNGFGTGWSLALTEYRPSNQIISLHSGESFKVTGNYADEGEPDRLKMKEQKIPTFKLYQLKSDPRGEFMVAHANGLVEILKLTGSTPQVAMPVKLYSPQGHEVTLAYQNFAKGRMLSTVRDNQGLLLEVIRNLTANTVEIRLKPVQGVPLAVFTLHMENDWLVRISLPTPNGAGWRFLYGKERDQLCIKQVWTPLGAHETIGYNDSGHGYPGNSGYDNLPRVTDHVTAPGGGQPPIVMNYSYSDNGNNFLGRNASIDWEDDEGDNLYKVLGQYLYESTERLMDGTQAVRTVTRTFNRFHLMTAQVSTQGNCRKSLDTTYYANDTDTFENQDPRCQLARQVTEMWYLTDDPRSWRYDKKLTEYDIHGNLIKTVQPNGITEEIVYYPAEEVPGECPADPYGFVRHVREKTVTPSSDPALVPDLQSGGATLRSRYRYESMLPINGSQTPWVALIEERLLEVRQTSEQLLQRVLYTFINEPANPVTHGRRQIKAVTTGEAPGFTTLTRYAYSKTNATYATFAGETVLRTVETVSTDFDSATKSVTHERSLLNGEPLLINDKDDEVRYSYDQLSRVVKEEESPNTPYPASRTFTYRLIRPAGQGESPVTDLAGQEMEDVKKAKVRTWLDGLGRTVKEEQEDLDNAGGNPPLFRLTYEARYDPFNQLLAETEIDWLEKTDLKLTNTYTYDLWGQRDSVTGPDGVTSHTRANPITFTVEQWTEGVGKSVTVTNRFEKTARTELYDLSGRRVSVHRFKYNGLGNCTEEVDALGRVSRFRYDAHGRLVANTLPDLTVISQTYSPHTDTPLVTSLTVQPGNIVLPPVPLGTQQYDGLQRLTQIDVGGRLQQLHYEDGRVQPCRRITPAGKPIMYEYKPGLTTQPTAIKPPEGDITYDYDLLNGNLETSSSAQGTYRFTYSHAGHLSTESWKEPGNPVPWVTRFTTSLKGRMLSRTDVGQQLTEADYNLTNGRLMGLRQCQLQAAFEYDHCGRLYRTTSCDLGSGNTLTTTLTFNDIGQEIERTLALRDSTGQPLQPVRSIELGYLADGNVQTRHLRVDNKTALLETFEYDLRGRLELYKCSGDELPKDRFGNAIVRQYFEFDAIDNVIYSSTDFDDGSQNNTQFGFANDDPCQLIKATHSHADYQVLVTDFSYDLDGNLTRDELGQQLSYDSQGRLLGVTTASGQPVTAYDYDAHDHLVAVRPEGEAQSLRFYEGTQLSDVVQNGQHTQLLRHRGHPLGQQKPGDDSQTLLLLADAKHSVIAESQADELRTAVYTAYGERSSEAQLQSLLAFNGEVRDPASGWYLLGSGYRAYNPCLMRFHSPDSSSPFGAGGINCYKYCLGNPIAFSDPSGHMATSVLDRPAVAYAAAGVALSVGIALSIFTFNPVPLALAATAIASAAGVSTATVVTIANGVLAATAAITTAANVLTLPTFVVGMGVEGVAMFTRDATARNNLHWIGVGIDMINLVKFKDVVTTAVPVFSSVKARTPSIVSTASATPRASIASHSSQASVASTTASAVSPVRPRRASTPDFSDSVRANGLSSSREVIAADDFESSFGVNIQESAGSNFTFGTQFSNASEVTETAAAAPPAVAFQISNSRSNTGIGSVLPASIQSRIVTTLKRFELRPSGLDKLIGQPAPIFSWPPPPKPVQPKPR